MLDDIKVSKTATIRNRYKQVPHLSKDTKWESNKITINITDKNQEGSPFPSDDPQKKYRLGTASKDILLEGLNRFHSAPTSPLVQMWIKTHSC